MLDIKCFGGLRVERGEQVIERFRTQKTAALLGLLALRGTQSREKICSLLWPDAAPEAARNSLSASLSSLRRDLGEVFKADRQNISLHATEFNSDVYAFDAALKNQNFAQAVEIYVAHLLPGFYEDPFPALVREYEEKARTAFLVRLSELEKDRDFSGLLSVAHRATVLFGDEERWFLAMMRAHYGLNDFDAAIRIYENFSRTLRKNGETASETSRALARNIRREKEKKSLISNVRNT